MIDEQALAWAIRTRDPNFRDWDAFTLWLEADPAHARAYDRAALLDADLPAILPAAPLPAPANDDAPDRRRLWRFAGFGTIAAALVAVLLVTVQQRSDPYSVTTAPGEQREVALSDGTRIALNGGTTLRLDRSDPRFAALDRGEAVFTVRHEEGEPFRVHLGDDVVEDVGTVFNIARSQGLTRVAVSEGEVVYNPRQEAISLKAGRSMTAREGVAQVTLANVSPDAVAGWRQGRLSYDKASMDIIADDIGRALGVEVHIAPAIRARQFTGTLIVERDAVRFFATAAPLLGVEARPDETGWILQAGNASLSN